MKNVTITNRKILTLYNPYSMKKERILLPGCTSNSKFKGNIICHMKDCGEQLKRKEEKSGNKKCQFCGKPFAQKSNRGRHVNSRHASEVSDDATTIPTFISNLESQHGPSKQPSNTEANTDHLTPLSSCLKVLTVSFVSDDGNTIDLEMSIIEKAKFYL